VYSLYKCVVSYEYDVLLYEDEVDNKMKKCETLNEGRICCVKVSPHPRYNE